jgi:protocatechuate 3,4-dioxygenase beta subunit
MQSRFAASAAATGSREWVYVNNKDSGAMMPSRGLGSVVGRRQALTFLTCASAAAMLSACGGGDATVTPAPSPTPTPGPAPTPTPTGCTVTKSEAAGPFAADGSNTAPGVTSNVLTQNGVVRADVRPSFIGSTTAATGVPVALTLTLVNTNAACAPLVGYAVYIYSADAQGRFSLYDVPAQSYLRGVQVTSASGQVVFTTLIPGVDTGRYPRFYIQVFPTAASATSGAQAILTTQLIIPAVVAQSVYSDATNYPGQAARFAAVSLAGDPAFGDNTTAENAGLTPSFSGSVAAGFTAGLTIGLPR